MIFVVRITHEQQDFVLFLQYEFLKINSHVNRKDNILFSVIKNKKDTQVKIEY